MNEVDEITWFFHHFFSMTIITIYELVQCDNFWRSKFFFNYFDVMNFDYLGFFSWLVWVMIFWWFRFVISSSDESWCLVLFFCWLVRCERGCWITWFSIFFCTDDYYLASIWELVWTVRILLFCNVIYLTLKEIRILYFSWCICWWIKLWFWDHTVLIYVLVCVVRMDLTFIYNFNWH